MQNYHNVSVRLDDNDFKQLKYLHDKFNRMSYGKVSLADVLRIAVKDLYVMEMKKEEPEKETASTIEVKEVKKEPVSTSSIDDIETQLEQLEKELREGTNSKGKPYSETYIQRELDKRRKELSI